MGPAQSDFLDAAVLAVRRSAEAIPDRCLAIGIERGVAADVNTAVINVRLEFSNGRLKARNSRSGMHERWAAVGANGEIRRFAEQIAAGAIAPEVVGHHA